MKVLVQGDSHVRYFREAFKSHPELKKRTAALQEIGGATAQGLANPKSKTNALVEFKRGLADHTPDVLITHLGEVDCGFVIWYWYQEGKRTIQEQIDLSIKNYIDYLVSSSVDRIIVTSPTVPAVRDNDPKDQLLELRKEIKASQLERTKLTLQYSEQLKQQVEKEGFEYLECQTELLNERGVVADKYRNNVPGDLHHLNTKIMGKLWGDKLIKTL